MNTNADLIPKVQDVIEKVRPYLQADGGDIRFIELTNDNIVKVELQGVCSSCPYSRMTLKNGVEEAIKRSFPEIVAVEEV